MSKWILVLLSGFAVTSSAAEVQLLLNYNPTTKAHNGEIHVTATKPVSLAKALMNSNGLCYKGATADVKKIIEAMAAVYNATQSAAKMGAVEVVAATDAPKSTLSIVVQFRSPEQTGTYTWNAVPYCVK